MATSKIQVGDTVRVIAGKSKGKEGKVTAVDRKNGKVTVEGANIVTKHQKPSMANQNGGIVQQEGNSLKGSLSSGGKKADVTVSIFEEGEEDLLLVVEGR